MGVGVAVGAAATVAEAGGELPTTPASSSLAVEPSQAVSTAASSAIPVVSPSAVWRLMSRPMRVSPDDDSGYGRGTTIRV